MASPRTKRPVFACTACGAEHARWVGRCTQCQGWGTVEQVPAGMGDAGGPARPRRRAWTGPPAG